MAHHAHDFVDASSGATTNLRCDLCGEAMATREFSQAVRDVSGMDICTLCLEETLDAAAFHPRAEMVLVGTSGGRP